MGDYRGTSWNSQALFASVVATQTPKQNFLTSLAATHDFVMLQETHSTVGAMETWSPPPGCRYFSSHLSQSEAGVGILVSHKFLKNFDPVPDDEDITPAIWEEIQPGRVACLRLSGPQGNLDLMVVYLKTGHDWKARRSSRACIAKAMRSNAAALTIIAGD